MNLKFTDLDCGVLRVFYTASHENLTSDYAYTRDRFGFPFGRNDGGKKNRPEKNFEKYYVI